MEQLYLLLQFTVLPLLSHFTVGLFASVLFSVPLFAVLSVILFNVSLVVSLYCKAHCNAVKQGAIKYILLLVRLPFKALNCIVM